MQNTLDPAHAEFARTRAEMAQNLGSATQARTWFTKTFLRGRSTIKQFADIPLVLERVHASTDGSTKLLWKLSDGHSIESVLIPHGPGQISRGLTLCVSSQVGCALACTFCETGTMGLVRHLTAGEILGQIWNANAYSYETWGTGLTHLVWMGMGEPLHNQDAVFKVLEIIRDPYGWSWSRRKIILSTAGWVPGIDALADSHPVRLAVSLHAADEALRSKLMPVQKRFPLSAVLDASERYVAKTGLAPFFEITLLRGINDSVEDADRLLAIADRMPCAFNLIPYNPGRYNPMKFERPDFDRVKAFQHALVSRGVTATIRKTAGEDVAAACGQLATVTSRILRGRHRNEIQPSL